MRPLDPAVPLTQAGVPGRAVLIMNPEDCVPDSATRAHRWNSMDTARQGDVLGMKHSLPDKWYSTCQGRGFHLSNSLRDEKNYATSGMALQLL